MLKSASEMRDSSLIAHFEADHSESIRMTWGKDVRHRRLTSRATWLAYHDHFLHKAPRISGHQHTGYLWTGWEKQDMTTGVKWEQRSPCNCLHPPAHSPDCTGRQGLVVLSGGGGSTAQDRLWKELVLCINLLKGAKKGDAEVSGFARGLATALAHIRSPLQPNVDAIRKEAMEMWRKQQEGSDG